MAGTSIDSFKEFGKIPANASIDEFRSYLDKSIFSAWDAIPGQHMRVTLSTDWKNIDLSSLVGSIDNTRQALIIMMCGKSSNSTITCQYCSGDGGAAYSNSFSLSYTWPYAPLTKAWWVVGSNMSNNCKIRLKSSASSTEFEYTVLVFYRYTGEVYDDEDEENLYEEE